jgi:8-oxo-dGTP pyrophosphatase MutT (NUDIX family)
MASPSDSGHHPLVLAVRGQVEDLGRHPSPLPVAGAVVVDRREHALLAYSTFAGQGWHFPKGGIEEGEDVVTAAMREATEETGVTGVGIPSLPLFALGRSGRYVEPLGFGSPRYNGDGPGISLGARGLLDGAARRAGVTEAKFERHKLALFDSLARVPVLWQTEATYCVLAWRDGEARQMPETSRPPRWVALEGLGHMSGLHAHAKKLLKSSQIKEAVAAAATHALS